MTGLDLDRIETAAKKGIWSVVLSSTVLALVARIREAEAHADAMIERAAGFEMRARRAEEDAQEWRGRAEIAESRIHDLEEALTQLAPEPWRPSIPEAVAPREFATKQRTPKEDQ